MKLLELVDVSAGYQNIQVLHDVSLEVAAGEMTAIIGPNGAGKSTLMKTISGLIRPYKGRILFDGQPIEHTSPDAIMRLGMGYVPQGQNIFGDLTVKENLEVAACFFPDASQRQQEMLERFPILDERRRQKARTLSGGERQMLAIACALLAKPRLLLLDEPTSGLAPQIVQEVIEQVLAIHRSGTSIVWVIEEHPREILQVIDRVYFLESGVIRHQDTGQRLLANERLVEMFFGHAQS